MKRKLKRFQKSIVLLLKFLLYLALIATFFMMFSINNKPILILSRTMGTTIVTFVVVGALMTNTYGHYDIGRRKSKPIIYSLILAMIVTDIITYLQLMIMNTISPTVFAFRLSDLGTLILVILAQLLIIIAFSYGGNAIYFSLRDPERCCIVTAGENDLLRLEKGLGRYKKQYRVEFTIDYRHPELKKALKKMDTVFLYELPIQKRGELLNYCYDHNINIYFNPEIPDIVENNAEHYLLDDISLLNANVKELSFEQRAIKRVFDILLAFIALVVTSPIWLVVAICIKAGDGGRVLFKQQRATKKGRVFWVYKFRTMREHVENRSVTADDDRITPVGRVLRKFRLDELPQLLNILKGDMSFVGPRPEMLENVYAYTEELPEFKYRLRVKAGLTGYAQIAGKYNTSPRDKLMLDLMYIEKYSFWEDLKLLFQTAIVVLKSDSTEAFQEDYQSTIPTYDDRKKQRGGRQQSSE